MIDFEKFRVSVEAFTKLLEDWTITKSLGQEFGQRKTLSLVASGTTSEKNIDREEKKI